MPGSAFGQHSATLGPKLEKYCYAPLPDGPYIRILMLHRGRQSDPLRGELELFNIHKGGDYEPLSYVWGDPSRSYEIICNNKSLSLTASLDGALRRVRRDNRPRRIWVDQVSVNQDDVKERSQQVQFMNTIYKNAMHVLVWLGDDCNVEAEGAFQLIRSLDHTFRDKESKERFRIRYTQHLRDQSEEQWTPLKHLTARPWVRQTLSNQVGSFKRSP